MRKEGQYTLQKVDRLPTRGNANWLYFLESDDPVQILYEWNSNGTYTAISIGGSGGIQSIVAGANITIDNTDPSNPVISSTGGGSAQLQTYTTDSFTGKRYELVDDTAYGFMVDKDVNGRIGYDAVNRSTGVSAATGFTARSSNNLYSDFSMLVHYPASYYATYLQNRGGLLSDQKMFFLAGNDGGFDFRSDTNIGTLNTGAWLTSLFQINADGTIVAPSLSIAEIDAGDNKGLVTKEWVQANSVSPSYSTYTALVTVNNEVSQTSGVLEVGKEYIIPLLVIGDDFSNVGYTSDLTPFIATGTTPTNWSNGTEVINLTDSAPTVVELENNTGETFDWVYDYDEGVISNVSNNILEPNKTLIFTGNNDGAGNATPMDFYIIDDATVGMKNMFYPGSTWSLEIKIYP